MASRPTFRSRRLSPSDQAVDLFDTVKAYARQETIDPLKGALRWVAAGSVAAISLGLALVFLSVGTLRMSQDLGGETLDGAWSFLHYFIAFTVMCLFVWLTFSRISRTTLAKE
jgi:hypothetical protein